MVLNMADPCFVTSWREISHITLLSSIVNSRLYDLSRPRAVLFRGIPDGRSTALIPGNYRMRIPIAAG